MNSQNICIVTNNQLRLLLESVRTKKTLMKIHRLSYTIICSVENREFMTRDFIQYSCQCTAVKDLKDR